MHTDASPRRKNGKGKQGILNGMPCRSPALKLTNDKQHPCLRSIPDLRFTLITHPKPLMFSASGSFRTRTLLAKPI